MDLEGFKLDQKLQSIINISFLFIIVLFVTACQQAYENDDMSSLPDSTDFGSDPLTDENLNLLQSDENMDASQFVLLGGPESEVREPRPVSNNILQQKYSDALVLRGSIHSNKVALSFDDGPDSRFTPHVLDVLDRHGVKATFFMIGSRAKELPELVKRIHESGHAIGNHTYWHPNLLNEELDRLHWEVTETENVLEEIIGFKPNLFRAPYGALTEDIVQMLADLNFTIVGWDVDSLDWKQQGAEVIQDNVLSNVGFGSIILMHDGGDWSMDLSGTAEALDEIIVRLKEDGTEFVTIPELVNVPKEKQ
mgnify:FL=1